MVCSPTHGTSHRRKSHYTHPIKEKPRNNTQTPSHKNNTLQQINIIPTQYAHSIRVHKRRLENQQSITDLQDLAELNKQTL